MRKLVGLATALLVTSPVYAGLYEYGLGNLLVPQSGAGISIPVQGLGPSDPIRGYYVGGDWTAGPGNPFSNEMRANLNNTGERAIGGVSNGNPFTFPPFGATWDNNTAPANVRTDLIGSATPQNALHDLKLRTTFLASSANLANAKLGLLTDALPPTSGAVSPGAPTFRRAQTLTTLAGSASSSYRYTTIDFTAPATGLYLVGADYGVNAAGAPTWDGYLHLYPQGAFNPANALSGLIGLDDDGHNALNGVDADKSAIWINLVGGQTYTTVVAQFVSNSASNLGEFTLYVAGVPEPASCSLLALVGLLFRKR